MMLIETALPVRWYLPRQDVRMDLLTPSEKHTVCAYKGVASYLSADGAPDVAWFYPAPLHDALLVKDLVGFWRPAAVYVDEGSVDTSMPGECTDATRVGSMRPPALPSPTGLTVDGDMRPYWAPPRDGLTPVA